MALDGERIASHPVFMQAEGAALPEQRMNHVDVRLAGITDKLDGLIGFMNGCFRKQ